MRMTWPHLSKAPIVEALIEVNVKPSAVTLDSLEAVHARVKDDYPTKHVRARQRVGLQRSSTTHQFVAEQERDGFAFVADDRRVFQACRDGFTFNWVGAYESWSALENEARRLYAVYFEAARPEAVEYVAVRYINRISIPEGAELEEWMGLRMVVPRALPQSNGGFQLRVLLPFGGFVAANVNSVVEPTGEHFDWVLDIDVRDLEKTPDTRPEAIWARLSRLREVKNEIFFNSVSERVLEAYR